MTPNGSQLLRVDPTGPMVQEAPPVVSTLLVDRQDILDVSKHLAQYQQLLKSAPKFEIA